MSTATVPTVAPTATTPAEHPLLTLAKSARTLPDARQVIAELSALKPVRPDFDGMTKDERKAALASGKVADAAYNRISQPVLRALADAGFATEQTRKFSGTLAKSGDVTVREVIATRFRQSFASVRV